MHLKTLRLKNFRSYSTLQVDFSPEINLIVGKNGCGKTNLIEAINFLSTGRSFRTTQLSELIKEGESYFFIEAIFQKKDVLQSIKVGYQKNAKAISYNSTKLPALSHLLGILPSTLFCPKDHAIVAGTPSERRRFLNILLAQKDPVYVQNYFRYARALKQKNLLLKQKKYDELKYFEQEMLEAGFYLASARKKVLSNLEETLGHAANRFSNHKELFSLRYVGSFDFSKENPKDEFAQLLEKIAPKEKILSTSLAGPHRDDIGIYQNGKLAKSFSSEGQKRSFLAALKCSEWEQLSSYHQEKPLMCIDDFGVHLDEHRIEKLTEEMKNFGQVFVTMPKNILQGINAKEFNIDNGSLNIV